MSQSRGEMMVSDFITSPKQALERYNNDVVQRATSIINEIKDSLACCWTPAGDGSRVEVTKPEPALVIKP